MANNKKQMEANKRWREKVGRVQINLAVGLKDREAWKAYATAQGLTLPAMVRACVARCMQADGYTAVADGYTATPDGYVHSDRQEAQTQTDENSKST